MKGKHDVNHIAIRRAAAQVLGRSRHDARSSASFNPTLTTFAADAASEVDISDALFLAPVVTVPSNRGYYKEYKRKEQIVVYNTTRALGQQPNMIGYTKKDATYDCAPQALGTFIDDATRDDTTDGGALLDEDGIADVVKAARRSLFYRVIAEIRAAKSAEEKLGNWNDAAVNPIKELNTLIVKLAKQCGLLPNRLWIDLSMWNTLTQHPLVLKAVSGVHAAVTLDIVRQLLTNNPAIQIKVGTAVVDTGNPGSNDASADFIGSGSCFLFYAESSPSRRSPNFASIFSKNADLLGDVRSWREEPCVDKHAVMWSDDIRIPSAISGARIDLVTK